MFNSQMYNNKIYQIMKTFNRRMWESVFERHFDFCEVEITDYRSGNSGVSWYGTFTIFSNLIDGVEHYYFFKILECGRIIYTKINV